MHTISRTRAELYLFSITIIWGSTFVLTKFVLASASPLVYIAIRFSLASVLFFALFFKKLRTMPKESCIAGTVLGVLLFIGFVLQTVGLKYTTASKSAFITGLMVVFTPLFQLLIENKPPKIGNIMGVVLITVGLYFMTSPKGSGFNIGDGLTLACAFIFSLYIIYLDVFSKKHNPTHLSFMQFISTAVIAVLAIPLLETPHLSINNSFILILIYLAVMPTAAALYVMTKYQRYTTPTRSVVIYSMEPPFAAIFAFFIIGEQIGIIGVMGGALILSGLLISELSDVLFKRKHNNDNMEINGRNGLK